MIDATAHDEKRGGFGGLRVIAFESRMAAETRALIERFGGRAMVAPAMAEAPIEDNPAAFEFADRLLAGGFDVVIFLTGVGVRELFRALDGRYRRADLVAALRGATTVARGPKPAAALRELGVEPSISVPEPNTWREILAAVDGLAKIAERRIAIQEYGAANHDLCAALEARGAVVTAVPVYRWTMPADREPLRAAIRAIVERQADCVLFTSSHQIANLMRQAADDGALPQLRQGLNRAAVGSIGPICAAELRARGIEVDIEPAHPKLGHLVKAAAAQAPAIIEQKRKSALAGARMAAPQARTPKGGEADISPRYARADHPLLQACRRERPPYTPVWLMRQAGRYMPEYRRVRERHSFLEMCQRPELAAEVTVTAVERLGVDAAIIFADILLPLLPLNVGLHYEKGDGPVIDRPVRRAADLERAAPLASAAALGFVGDAIKMTRTALGDRKPIIGFAGAPFTLASYLIEGGGSRNYQATKTLMYTQPDLWDRIMKMIVRVTGDYLNLQVEAGADLVQIFDSWVGCLGPDDYRRYVMPYSRATIAAVRSGTPVIHFSADTASLLELMRDAGGDVIGVDWRVDLAHAWARLGDGVGVQGNFDPIALFADTGEIRRRAKAILDAAGGRPGHIFNLGHGILPETPVDNVRALIDIVHELGAR